MEANPKREMRIKLCSEPAPDYFLFERDLYVRGYIARSRVLVCPLCRTVWAELHVEGSNAYEAYTVSCSLCQWHHQGYEFLHPVPGSLLDNPTVGGVDWPMLDSLPEALLRRELELTLKAWDSHPW